MTSVLRPTLEMWVLSGFLFLTGVTHISGGESSSIWAVLVAGSNGWENYRHQADICHAYQVLVQKGLPKDRIIVMMYDDIANNRMNPDKGVIRNEPHGVNVYEGVNIDYREQDVNVENFKNVLLGNKTALKGRGTGRVLESGPNDHVFINFVDHGATGVLSFPNEYLHADVLLDVFRKMKSVEKFGKLVMFVEACESGSMFDNLLGSLDNVLVSTASAPDESSWGWYCEETCLGDLYSITWINRLKKLNSTESLFEHFDAVRTEVLQKSHVNLYGDYRLGYKQFGKFSENVQFTSSIFINKDSHTNKVTGVDNRDVPLHIAQRELEKLQLQSENEASNLEITNDLNTKKRNLQNIIMGRRLADSLISMILDNYVRGNSQLKNEIESNRLPLNENMFDCYKTMISTFDTYCFKIAKHYYFLKHLYKFANICINHKNESEIILTIQEACNGLNFNGMII